MDCNTRSSDLKSTDEDAKEEEVEIVEIVEAFEFDADKYQH